MAKKVEKLEKKAVAKKVAPKKSAPVKEPELEEEEEEELEEQEEEEEAPVVSKSKGKKAAPANKAEKEPKEKKEPSEEGVTKETKETGVISFKDGSGSNDLLKLIQKYGFNREKVLAAAAKLKEAGKAFSKCDPEKKYNKVAGLIKGMQEKGYKLTAETVEEEVVAPAKKKVVKKKVV